MKSESVEPQTSISVLRSRRSRAALAVAPVACLALVLAACGGGDDDDDAGSTTTEAVAIATQPTSTTAAPTTTLAPTTTTPAPLELVTEGATLVVANASSVNGAAGRMSEALAAAGFSTGAATNSSEGKLQTTKVYYDPDDPAVKPVAESVVAALGGGDIELLELSVPAPTDTGELNGAQIVVAMGEDIVDQSLADLQRTQPAVTAADDEASDDSGADDTTATSEPADG